MKYVKTWIVFTLLILTACGRPSKLPENSDALSAGGSAPGFDILLQKIFQPKCVACHASFATHGGIMSAVVAGNPDASVLYTKVATGQMPKNGTPLSSSEVTAIFDWISAGAPAVTANNPTPGSSGGSPVLGGGAGGTAPAPTAISPTFAWIQANVLTPRCVICHRGAGAPGGYDLSSYANVLAGGRVVAGNPAGSRFFQRIDNNSMPPGGPALAADVKTAIRQWIQNGANNDAPAGGLPPGSTPPPPPPLPPLEPKYASLAANIFGPRCTACHNSTTATAGVNLQTYAGVLRQVRAGVAADSDLYDEVEKNDMPASGPPLSFAQKENIRLWINAGALNN